MIYVSICSIQVYLAGQTLSSLSLSPQEITAFICSQPARLHILVSSLTIMRYTVHIFCFISMVYMLNIIMQCLFISIFQVIFIHGSITYSLEPRCNGMDCFCHVINSSALVDIFRKILWNLSHIVSLLLLAIQHKSFKNEECNPRIANSSSFTLCCNQRLFVYRCTQLPRPK